MSKLAEKQSNLINLVEFEFRFEAGPSKERPVNDLNKLSIISSLGSTPCFHSLKFKPVSLPFASLEFVSTVAISNPGLDRRSTGGVGRGGTTFLTCIRDKRRIVFYVAQRNSSDVAKVKVGLMGN